MIVPLATVGVCSLCGGDVVRYGNSRSGGTSLYRQCKKCGAYPKSTLPVIEMEHQPDGLFMRKLKEIMGIK